MSVTPRAAIWRLTQMQRERRKIRVQNSQITPIELPAISVRRFGRSKTVNDTYGHEEGDALLIIITDAMVAVYRPGDFVDRLGTR